MAFPDRRTVNVLLTTLLFAVVLAIVYIARAVMVIFAFSILFAYLINPVVRFLQRHSLIFKNLRGPHVAEAYLALLILVGFIVYGFAPQFIPSVRRLIKQSPALMENLYSGDIAVTVAHQNRWDETKSLRVKSFLQQHGENIRALVGSVSQSASAVFGGIALIPILGLFFLSDGEKLANRVIHLISTSETYETARALASDLNDMLRHYISGPRNPWSSIFYLLLHCHASPGLPARAGSRAYGGRLGIYSHSRLDHGCNYHRNDWAGHSLPLDLDGRAAWSMADGHGLRNFSARHRP